MSDELVEQLRKQAWQRSGAPKMDAGHTKMLEWKAADEIERLREALQRISDWCPATQEITLAHQMADEAQAALAEKDAANVR